jgi:hypothetical protein
MGPEMTARTSLPLIRLDADGMIDDAAGVPGS